MKMHEGLGFENLKEPRNRVKCKFRVSVVEDSSEPIQLWFSDTLRKQGIFLTEENVQSLIESLQSAQGNLK